MSPTFIRHSSSDVKRWMFFPSQQTRLRSKRADLWMWRRWREQGEVEDVTRGGTEPQVWKKDPVCVLWLHVPAAVWTSSLSGCVSVFQ